MEVAWGGGGVCEICSGRYEVDGVGACCCCDVLAQGWSGCEGSISG